MTTPYQPEDQRRQYAPASRNPPQQVQYNLGTAKLNKKFGTLGTVVWVILGVVFAGGVIVSVVAQSIVPIGLVVIACIMVVARRFLRPRRTGVIGKQAMGTITIGGQGIAIANVQGRANVFSWNEIDAIGVLRWKENIAFRSGSARVAQMLRPMRPGVPVYLPISLLYVEAPNEEVIGALHHFAGPRFVGVDLEKSALGG
ncbi:hypothetical protein ITP53_02910 [Nonomuraea sp. K274]|uniref:Uncharacterized protein n=1 Tax=Nonomuraea cypriaca TaxID=1187855 RepID=A0A931A409_9ACTN|nr:hypothetical protein [Nonomuraea cypriaca]MBF8184708.1 hypothetical protein [Nonomuraea cypriaca]